MTSRAKTAPKVAIFDFLTVLLVFFLIIALLETPAKPTVETYGVMAVTSAWQTQDDIDLYVRNPQGDIVYFASPQGGLMYLEHDTIPLVTDVAGTHKTAVQGEHERVVLTGVIPGEYTVDVMMYDKVKSTRGPCDVTVRVWALRGQDRVLLTKVVTLQRNSQERTAFRFTLNASGQIVRVSHVQANLAGVTLGDGPQLTGGGPHPPSFGG